MHKDGYNMEKSINKTIQLIIIFSILNVVNILKNEVILTKKQLINLTDLGLQYDIFQVEQTPMDS